MAPPARRGRRDRAVASDLISPGPRVRRAHLVPARDGRGETSEVAVLDLAHQGLHDRLRDPGLAQAGLDLGQRQAVHRGAHARLGGQQERVLELGEKSAAWPAASSLAACRQRRRASAAMRRARLRGLWDDSPARTAAAVSSSSHRPGGRASRGKNQSLR